VQQMLAASQWATAAVAQTLLSWLGTPLTWQGDRLAHANGFVAQMHADCTAAWPALSLLVALLVFGVQARTPSRRLAVAATVGVLAIIVVNQLRLVAVLWTGVHAPALFAWVHELLGPLLLVATGAMIVAIGVRGVAPNAACARMPAQAAT
jgi:exosortase/archaeosortase family protein